MLTVFNEKKKKIYMIMGNAEALLRTICESNEKLFSKETNNDLGIIKFKSLSNTEAKINTGIFYLWKNYILEFRLS